MSVFATSDPMNKDSEKFTRQPSLDSIDLDNGSYILRDYYTDGGSASPVFSESRECINLEVNESLNQKSDSVNIIEEPLQKLELENQTKNQGNNNSENSINKPTGKNSLNDRKPENPIIVTQKLPQIDIKKSMAQKSIDQVKKTPEQRISHGSNGRNQIHPGSIKNPVDTTQSFLNSPIKCSICKHPKRPLLINCNDITEIRTINVIRNPAYDKNLIETTYERDMQRIEPFNEQRNPTDPLNEHIPKKTRHHCSNPTCHLKSQFRNHERIKKCRCGKNYVNSERKEKLFESSSNIHGNGDLLNIINEQNKYNLLNSANYSLKGKENTENILNRAIVEKKINGRKSQYVPDIKTTKFKEDTIVKNRGWRFTPGFEYLRDKAIFHRNRYSCNSCKEIVLMDIVFSEANRI